MKKKDLHTDKKISKEEQVEFLKKLLNVSEVKLGVVRRNKNVRNKRNN